jgi:molybdopterin synthase sulfur carrier subunit
MAVLRLFAAAREAAGTDRVVIEGATVGEILEQAAGRFGEPFCAVLGRSRVWVNGQEVARGHPVAEHDEVAVLPPVSGGA